MVNKVHKITNNLYELFWKIEPMFKPKPVSVYNLPNLNTGLKVKLH